MPKGIKFRTSERGTDRVRKKFSKLDNSLVSMTKSAIKLGIAFVGLRTIKRIGQTAVNTAAQFEALRTRLNVMTGSIKEGTRLFETFNEVAADTPFQLMNVVEAGATLRAFGADAEATIKPVADLAAFMGVGIVDAASSFGRAFAAGAGAADILRERGVLTLIRLKSGIEDLTKLTLPEFRRILIETIQNPTAGIAGATTALAETFVGRYSNMQDAVARLSASFGEILMPAVTDAINVLQSAADWSRKFLDRFSDVAEYKGMTDLEIKTKILHDELNKYLLLPSKGGRAMIEFWREQGKEIEFTAKGMQEAFTLTGFAIKSTRDLLEEAELGVELEKAGILTEKWNLALKESGLTMEDLTPENIEKIVIPLMKSTESAEMLARYMASTSSSLLASAFMGDSLAESLKRAVLQMVMMVVQAKIYNYLMQTAFPGGFFVGVAKTLFGFQHGGSFIIPGGGSPDSQLVAFRGTPGERVTVETPAQQITNVDRGITINVMSGADTNWVRDYVKPELEKLEALGA